MRHRQKKKTKDILARVIRQNLFLLFFSLGVDHGGERFLDQQDNLVHSVDHRSGKQTSRLTVKQGCAEETEGRAIVHWVVADVEWEVDDSFVKQEAKVVPEIRADNAQFVH